MKSFNRILVYSFVLVALFQSINSLAYGSFWNSQKYKEEIRKTFVGHKIKITPLVNKIRIGFGTFSLGDFHYVKTHDKIFYQTTSIQVIIKKIDFENEMISAKLFHPKYGFGGITFFFDEEQYKNTDSNKLREVFDSALTNNLLDEVIVNTKTGIYHLPNCNHLPSEKIAKAVSREQAELSGNKPCGFCFKSFKYLPEYQLEQVLAHKKHIYLGDISSLKDNAEQKQLSNIGQKILDSWPVGLLGYDYRFTLIDTPEVNVFSLPGGQIFVTTGLYQSLENPLELEAILVHEVAHIERRHALKIFKAIQKTYKQAISENDMGNSLFELIGDTLNDMYSSSARSAMATSLAMTKTLEIIANQYPEKYNLDADLFANFYFSENHFDKKWVRSSLKKLEFFNLGNPTNKIENNYALRAQLHDRLDALTNTTFQALKGGYLYCQNKKLSYAYIEPLFLSEYNNVVTLLLYIDDNSIIKKMNDYDTRLSQLSVEVGGKKIKFKYRKKNTLFTEFGAVTTFVYKNKKKIKMERFSGAKLTISQDTSSGTLNTATYNFSAL